MAVEIVQRALECQNAAADAGGLHVLVRIGKLETVLREGAKALPGQPVEAAGQVGQGEGGCAGLRGVRPGGILARPRRRLSGGGRCLFRAGLRDLDVEPARGDDDQPADGGFGRAQQAHDPTPDPARHEVCAALVETGIGEQRRDDAQKRGAVAGNRRGPAGGLRMRHPGEGRGRAA